MGKIVKFTILITILITILLTLPSILCAETYKWVNEDGVVTYSQTPPPDVDTETVHIKSAPPKSGQSSREKLDNLRQRMADSAEDRELQKTKQKEEKEIAALKQQNCEAARGNLQRLEGLGSRLYKKGGEYMRLTEEERQSLMQEERENIKANCEP